MARSVGIVKEGAWDKVRQLITSLKGDMKEARDLCLKRWGLKAEAIARGHISAQDLGWRPLKPKTIAAKVRQGYSENILVMTSSYFQSITSTVKGDTAFAGVKRGVKHKSGQEMVKIAAVHEFGNTNTPARPLWGPTYEETMQWTVKSNRPADILQGILEKKYGKPTVA